MAAGRHAELTHYSALLTDSRSDSGRFVEVTFTTKESLMPPILGEPTSVSLAPHGLDQICATFGDVFQYILSDHTLDPRWQSEFLTRVQLPFDLTLSWDKSRTVRQMTCHKLIGEAFSSAFGEVQRAGLQSQLTSFGGCFAF